MDKILVLDFGGQYNQLIARRVRSMHVFAEVRPCGGVTGRDIAQAGYKGVIFTGGPNSVYDAHSPHADPSLLTAGVPVLGICYGHQLMAYLAGGGIAPAHSGSEYGKTQLFTEPNVLFRDVPRESVCFMSHTDFVEELPAGFRTIAHTAGCSCAAMCDEQRKLYGVQFHPEVTHTVYGMQILHNFVFDVCGCRGDWIMEDFISRSVDAYRRQLAGKKVLLALSGGVDSSVAAVLLHKAIGSRLFCVFVDHGLLRKGEGERVEQTLGRELGVNVIRVRAEERFLQRLKGIVEPEQKRRIIGEEFIRVFEEQAGKLGRIDLLAQGTIYPDVIESGKGDAAVIKSHHNVGGLPETMAFRGIVEPLRDLFKDEVREVGEKLGIPQDLVRRQPFPGPGLAVRVIGEVTAEKLRILREADAVFREELDRADGPAVCAQYFAVLTDTRSVGVMGDARTYGCTVALRAVQTDDFMTAEWARLPYELLEKASSRITNEIRGVTRVVYDITSKPPATVEWE
ncbi:MAG: glutamine-hydrolyzing GMP synthase [Clostridia bacterium]|nr:glutamine-hydrolyzing GMP synthase [Clostridia bacterium]